MYLHIGLNYMIKKKDIIGIFDIETTTGSNITRQFLAKAQKADKVESVAVDLPRSFIVCKYKKEEKVYLTQLSAATLQKRNSLKDNMFNNQI